MGNDEGGEKFYFCCPVKIIGSQISILPQIIMSPKITDAKESTTVVNASTVRMSSLFIELDDF